MLDCVSFMGVDPGITTGIAVIDVPVDSIAGDAPSEIIGFRHLELYGSLHRQVSDISDLAAGLYPGNEIVRPVMAIEDFDLDPKYHSRDKNLLAPVRMIGALEYAHECNHFGFLILQLQNRSIAKRDATDDRLKAWGLYTSGSDHVRDATRQAITMIRRIKSNRQFRMEVWRGTRRAALLAGQVQGRLRRQAYLEGSP